MTAELPDVLIQLERAALDAHTAVNTSPRPDGAWAAWLEAAGAVQAAITEHAAAKNLSRFELEMAVKKAARHPEPDKD